MRKRARHSFIRRSRSSRVGPVDAGIDSVRARAFTVPTADGPESDGTLTWDATTIVIVELDAGGERGLGYSYCDARVAGLVADVLAPELVGGDPFDVPLHQLRMQRRLRNLGRPALGAMAISAVDVALWDLKAKLLGVPLCTLLGRARDEIAIYGSGGFTQLAPRALVAQLRELLHGGATRVKMKVGSQPPHDLERVRHVREALGSEIELFVDANGAYQRKEALAFAEGFAALGVRWFEEPVSSEDLEGLRLLRDRAPAPIAIAAGEYGDVPVAFLRMLQAQAVDVLQADATRCLGVSGFLAVDALCDAFQVPLSSHCAPALHVHLGCAARRMVHLEWFYDHVRLEHLFFDGAPTPSHGVVRPDLSRPGLGLELKERDATRYLVGSAAR